MSIALLVLCHSKCLSELNIKIIFSNYLSNGQGFCYLPSFRRTRAWWQGSEAIGIQSCDLEFFLRSPKNRLIVYILMRCSNVTLSTILRCIRVSKAFLSPNVTFILKVTFNIRRPSCINQLALANQMPADKLHICNGEIQGSVLRTLRAAYT